MLHIGQSLEVVILEVDREKERVSLGLKQMTDNPWADIERKYPINSHVKGRVTKLLPYGAFVELERAWKAWCTFPNCPGSRESPVRAMY